MSHYTGYHELKKAVEQARRDIASLGYPELLSRHLIVGTSPRSTQWLGKAQKKKEYGENFFVLTFNLPYMAISTDKEALNVIYHEVAHTIKGGQCHTGEWKKCAEKISLTYHLDIARTTWAPEYLNFLQAKEASKIQYIPFCQECGEEFRSYTTKTGKVVKSILAEEKRYYCPRCKSTNLRINIQVPQF